MTLKSDSRHLWGNPPGHWQARSSPGRQTLLALFALLLGFCCSAATFTASLEPTTIMLGESAALALEITDGEADSPPGVPQVQNLQVAYAGPTRQFKLEGNQTSTSTTYNFRLTPLQVGDYTIPAIEIVVKGQKLTSQPLQLKVQKSPPAPNNAGSQLAFIRLALPKTEVYVGETVVAQLQVYLHRRVRNISGFQITSAPDGFNMGKLQQGQIRQLQISNEVYTVIPVNLALTAVKTGTFSTESLAASATLHVQSANRRRDPFFDQFGMRDPFEMLGGGTEAQQAVLSAQGETVKILTLPSENIPGSFSGAVGTFTLTVSAGPTNVSAGDPITVKIQVAGRGSIENVTLPQQPGWENFKVFPPTSRLELADQLGIQGTKTFEQIVSPASAEVKSLPPVGFSFFDPEQKRYSTLTHPPIPLTVRPGATPVGIVALPTPRKDDPSPAAQDIVPNKQRPGVLAQAAPPLLFQPWFILLQGLPIFAFAAALLWRRRSEQLARNPRLRRQRQVAELVAKGLAQLRELAQAKQSEQFFATVFHLLQEQLGERLDLPASSITEAVIDEHLRPRSVKEDLLAALQELFQTCNLARYAPVRTSHELESMIPNVERVLRQLASLHL